MGYTFAGAGGDEGLVRLSGIMTNPTSFFVTLNTPSPVGAKVGKGLTSDSIVVVIGDNPIVSAHWDSSVHSVALGMIWSFSQSTAYGAGGRSTDWLINFWEWRCIQFMRWRAHSTVGPTEEEPQLGRKWSLGCRWWWWWWDWDDLLNLILTPLNRDDLWHVHIMSPRIRS